MSARLLSAATIRCGAWGRVVCSLLLVPLGQHAVWAATPAQRCAAAKIKAVAAAGDAALRCFNDAVAKGVSIDPACRAAVCTELVADFLEAEEKGGCETVDDAERTCARIVDPFGVIVASKLPRLGGAGVQLRRDAAGAAQAHLRAICRHLRRGARRRRGESPRPHVRAHLLRRRRP
jgi:hypothetical protein